MQLIYRRPPIVQKLQEIDGDDKNALNLAVLMFRKKT